MWKQHIHKDAAYRRLKACVRSFFVSFFSFEGVMSGQSHIKFCLCHFFGCILWNASCYVNYGLWVTRWCIIRVTNAKTAKVQAIFIHQRLHHHCYKDTSVNHGLVRTLMIIMFTFCVQFWRYSHHTSLQSKIRWEKWMWFDLFVL